MRRLLKFLVRIGIAVGLAFIAYAMLAELPAPTGERTVGLPLPKDGG